MIHPVNDGPDKEFNGRFGNEQAIRGEDATGVPISLAQRPVSGAFAYLTQPYDIPLIIFARDVFWVLGYRTTVAFVDMRIPAIMTA